MTAQTPPDEEVGAAEWLPASALRTWPMWVFSVDPLAASAVLLLVPVLAGPFGPAAVSGTAFILSVLFYAADVVLAWLDQRTLMERGVIAPMRWGWAFLPIVYLIGRGVVLKRRTGRGMMLTWVGLAVTVLDSALNSIPFH